ncbi:MAG: chromosome segregation protein SMC [Defluviitaleaceae bacterium]|nr:chromosome segregation protein SMC [Defluviitaleaceae bacterium]
MYLARLEMIGFKSFPEKIRLEFDRGITAVVGPNGSGKSNVSDAIRWVLGEQSARTLRGAKMEDVIFAGTANRKPLGFAEVTMVVDNRDGALKIGYEEVSITRRVYRSGESEYSINGTSCRLKDIHELFMDTGLGKEGYSIIGQGRVEEVLASKGEERRLLLEEAAGIVKYKTRRFEALNKLEKERTSLERVEDLINEIESTLEPLSIQSETAKKYLKFAEELKLVQVNIFISEVESAQEKIDKIDENLQIVRDQIESTEKSKLNCEIKIDEYADKIQNFEEEVGELSSQIGENRSQFEQSENDIILKEEQVKHINLDIENLKVRIDEKQNSIEEDTNELEKFDNQLAELTKELDEKNVLLVEKDKEFSGLTSIMSEEEEEVQNLNQSVYDLMEYINNINNDLSRFESSYEQLEHRMEQIGEDAGNAKERLDTDAKEAESLSNTISNYDLEIEKLNNSLLQLSLEKGELSSELSDNKDLLKVCSAKRHEAEYRSKMLSELESLYEGYNSAVKSILSRKKSNPTDFSGIIGAVGELVSMDKRFETAIEIALGASVQNIVTKTENDAKSAIEYLKKNNRGRATFLPISTIKARNTALDKALLKEKGVIGTALDLCSFDKEYSNVFSSLLANTAIVDNMDSAISLSKKYNYANRLVTLEGELINPGGAITGGSVSGKVSGIFSRKRELGSLDVEIRSLTTEENRLSDIIAGIKKQLDAIDFQRDNSGKELQAIEVSKSASVEKLNQLNNLLAAYKENIEALTIEEAQLMASIVECNTNIRSSELSKKTKEDEIEAAKEKINLLNELIISQRLEKDSKYNDLTNLKVVIASLAEKHSNIKMQIEALKGSGHSNLTIIDKLNIEIGLKNSEFTKRKQEIEELTDKKERLKGINIKLNDEIETKQGNFKKMRDELKKFEEGKLDSIEQLSILSNEKMKLELQKEHIDEDLRKTYDHMWNEYELTYNSAKEYPKLDIPLSKLASSERSLKSDIRQLGDVNVGAIEEYRSASERYEFLTTQAADIKEAEEKLKELISQLTEMMEKQFRAHFAVISDNFSSVFKDIFGGGTAYLQLSDEENVLESGIEIIAKPPGKALQNLSLLSGGERALTATALLFAILRMKPSPFCILDEIESALDDANAARYINYLQKFRGETQFILITHRKSVMEAADVLYGITMQEQGVSALVSVKFEGESA